jgi:dipeptidase E
MADAERWAADIGVPAYAIDEQTAIKVVAGAVEVVSEGRWELFTPDPDSGADRPARLRRPRQL